MKNKKETPKHSVGKGAQKEQLNSEDEPSYVEDPKNEESDGNENDGDYLEQKWKKIASDFRQKYKIDVTESEYKDDSFSEVLKKLESKTGKNNTALKQEIKDWKHS